MKAIIILLVIHSFLNQASAQFPDAATIKKQKIKTIAASGDGGTEYSLFDQNGYEIKSAYEDEEFKKPSRINSIYYNAANQPDSIISTLGSRTDKEYFIYSADGSYLRIILSGSTDRDSIWYNKKGKEIKTKYASGETIKYEYNAKGQLTKMITIDKKGAMSNTTTFNYNALGQLAIEFCKEEYNTSSIKYEYNKQGLLTKAKRSSGWTTTYYYTFY